MGIPRDEYESMPLGCFLDLVACHMVENGAQVKSDKPLDEIMIP